MRTASRVAGGSRGVSPDCRTQKKESNYLKNCNLSPASLISHTRLHPPCFSTPSTITTVIATIITRVCKASVHTTARKPPWKLQFIQKLSTRNKAGFLLKDCKSMESESVHERMEFVCFCAWLFEKIADKTEVCNLLDNWDAQVA